MRMILPIMAAMLAACSLPAQAAETQMTVLLMPCNPDMPFLAWDRNISRFQSTKYHNAELLLTDGTTSIPVQPLEALEYALEMEGYEVNPDESGNIYPQRTVKAPLLPGYIKDGQLNVLLRVYEDAMGVMREAGSLRPMQTIPPCPANGANCTVSVVFQPRIAMKNVWDIIRQCHEGRWKNITLGHSFPILNRQPLGGFWRRIDSAKTSFEPEYPRTSHALIAADSDGKELSRKLTSTLESDYHAIKIMMHPRFDSPCILLDLAYPGMYENPFFSSEPEEKTTVRITRTAVWHQALIYPAGTYIGGWFYRKSEEHYIDKLFLPRKDGRKYGLRIGIDPTCRMRDIWPTLSRLFRHAENRVSISTSMPKKIIDYEMPKRIPSPAPMPDFREILLP